MKEEEKEIQLILLITVPKGRSDYVHSHISGVMQLLDQLTL